MKANLSLPQCPFPISQYPKITSGHGSGGKLTQRLIEEIFIPIFDNEYLKQNHDGAVMPFAGRKLAMTTDSYVITPMFFPGGDIGKLSVTGTLNDLTMCGAKPLYLSCAFIIEEGVSSAGLIQVAQSMRKVADENNIAIVTGDIKVIESRKEPSLFINTTGVGVVEYPQAIGPKQIQDNDVLIITGDIGRHEMAILATRQSLEFEYPIKSDCASLVSLIDCLLKAQIDIHCLRDLTRGGLATVCYELSKDSGLTFQLYDADIPVTQSVHAGCEILGLNPYYMANEGCCLIVVPPQMKALVLTLLREHPLGKGACAIGQVLPTKTKHGNVICQSPFATKRILNPLLAGQFPRIC